MCLREILVMPNNIATETIASASSYLEKLLTLPVKLILLTYSKLLLSLLQHKYM